MSNNSSGGGGARESAIIGLVAETSVHVGIGQASGALDLPVARESTTHYPFIPGSGVKGAMRVWSLRHLGQSATDDLFGKQTGQVGGEEASTQAGTLLWSDAKLLMLPVRATSMSYRLVTCPGLISRYRRDRRRAGLRGTAASDILVNVRACLAGAKVDDWIGMEEREFRCAGPIPPELADELYPIVEGSMARDTMVSKLTILSDDDFVWFAKYALPVMARNKLTENKTVDGGALWYEETIAPDSFFYMLLAQRQKGAVDRVVGTLQDDAARYVQMGGNETIGQGWLRMTPLDGAR